MTLLQAIQTELFRLQDTKYRDFQYKLIPTVEPRCVIGVRTPNLRKYAKQLYQNPDISSFLNALPHQYFDENQLHAFVISELKEFELCIQEVTRFLPFVDNWATCDQMSPKIFKKHRAELLSHILQWIHSDHVYTVRFAIGMLMQHYLDDAFKTDYPEIVSSIHSDEYYINMMIAWYFATALAKQYDSIIPYIQNDKLDVWTHNKTIQKAVESYRITNEQKIYLKSLKRKGLLSFWGVIAFFFIKYFQIGRAFFPNFCFEIKQSLIGIRFGEIEQRLFK